MDKDFDRWNRRKKKIEYYLRTPNFREGDIWWYSAGLNVGMEIDGKHNRFERPVYVLQKCGQSMFLGIPCTNAEKEASYMHAIRINGMSFKINFSQIKAISSKRLIKKITRSHTKESVLRAFIFYLKRKPASYKRAIYGAKWQK